MADYCRLVKLDDDKIKPQDVSWLMLLAIAAIMVGALHLLSYNVIYTEGEVMQGLFKGLVFATASFVLIGVYRRRIAVWCIALLGGFLLLWQANQLRNWSMLHEEVVAIIKFAEDERGKTGIYPASLEGYSFKTGWVKSHIYNFGTNNSGGLGITYFMNDPGITYWYSSKTGFGYYPD